MLREQNEVRKQIIVRDRTIPHSSSGIWTYFVSYNEKDSLQNMLLTDEEDNLHNRQIRTLQTFLSTVCSENYKRFIVRNHITKSISY